jgi:predicted AlkP superfamily phosphohydrolase/phosphomutase
VRELTPYTQQQIFNNLQFREPDAKKENTKTKKLIKEYAQDIKRLRKKKTTLRAHTMYLHSIFK